MLWRRRIRHKVCDVLWDWFSLEKVRQAVDFAVGLITILLALQAARIFTTELQAQVETVCEGYLTFDQQTIEEYLDGRFGEGTWTRYRARQGVGRVLSCLAGTRYPVYPEIIVLSGSGAFPYSLYDYDEPPTLYDIHDDNSCRLLVGLLNHHEVISSLSRPLQDEILKDFEGLSELGISMILTETVAFESLSEPDVERLLGAFDSAVTVRAVVALKNVGSTEAKPVTLTLPTDTLKLVGKDPNPISLRAESSERYDFQGTDNQVGKWTRDVAKATIGGIEIDWEPKKKDQINWDTVRKCIWVLVICGPIAFLSADFCLHRCKARRMKAPPTSRRYTRRWPPRGRSRPRSGGREHGR